MRGKREREDSNNGIPSPPARQPALSGISGWQQPPRLPWLNLELSRGGLLRASFIIHQLKKDPVQFLPSAVSRCSEFICSHDRRQQRRASVFTLQVVGISEGGFHTSECLSGQS